MEISSKFNIVSENVTSEDLVSFLESHLGAEKSNIKFEIPKMSRHLRSGIEQTIVVAIVGAIATGVGALLNGLLQIAIQRSINKIVIQTKSGARLEVPADTPSEKIDELLDKLKAFDIDKIYLP